ncbi:hypothetical protein BZG36_04538 [Bifiguratus adelaidae]|uniref:Uncharacterized protein n=1 Tax=Bifiguratus adelaidae TaxID=1938954 RepID=A0A261XXW2_9FUNG|nr:hypothetical protein BZG36_04538 [Bifiguratus adelaidae]
MALVDTTPVSLAHSIREAPKPKEIAQAWLSQFNQAVHKADAAAVDRLFLPNGYWRDLMALTWNFRTVQTPGAIKAFWQEHLADAMLSNIHLQSPEPQEVRANVDFCWVQAFFSFETKVGRGRGLVRLMKDNEGEYRAMTLYTGLEELKGFEEKAGVLRSQGVEHGDHKGRKSWKTRRQEEREFLDKDPTVLIVGGGQAGLTLAARLKQLGVSNLIVEQNERIGDNWRKRYDFLVLHDPVWYDHLPYVPFPAHWPVFTPKDKLADWFEAYVTAMELNVWTSATLQHSTYDDKKHTWKVDIARRPDGSVRTLYPKHVVLATGHAGEPNVPKFKGMEQFKGKVIHSSQHKTGGDFRGQKAIVVGCCNSGHDLAQDFYEQGADVTIVQRSSTYVMSTKQGLPILNKGTYEEGGPPTEVADLMFHSVPNHLQAQLLRYTTNVIKEEDKELLEGLERAGFKLHYGDDGSGLLMLYFRRGGGYYLDVGASQLIIDGKIKMKQGQEINHFDENGIVFADGSRLDADIVVLATGYKNMRETARRIFGDEVANRTGEVWGLDESGEMKTIWQRSGHPGFWYMGGNLALCRFMSKRLALLLLAIEQGLAPYE